MRRSLILLCFVSGLTGCSVSDAISDSLFAVFGDHYTEGGTLQTEKRQHYEQNVRQSQDYGNFGSFEHTGTAPWND